MLGPAHPYILGNCTFASALLLVEDNPHIISHRHDSFPPPLLTLLARTNCVTSLTILAFVFGFNVVNHFASRTLPWREMSRIQLIWRRKGWCVSTDAVWPRVRVQVRFCSPPCRVCDCEVWCGGSDHLAPRTSRQQRNTQLHTAHAPAPAHTPRSQTHTHALPCILLYSNPVLDIANYANKDKTYTNFNTSQSSAPPHQLTACSR